MTEREHNQLIKKIDKELSEYQEYMMTKDKMYVYESFYEIHGHEEIHDYLVEEGKKFNYKGFPQKDIIEWLYNRFMKTDYNLCYEDLGYLTEYETERYLKQQDSQGME